MTSDLLRLRRSIVAMMQAAQRRTCSHSPRAWGLPAAEWSSLAQSKMSSVFGVIAEVLGQKALQMQFVKRDHMVQKVTAGSSRSIAPRFRSATDSQRRFELASDSSSGRPGGLPNRTWSRDQRSRISVPLETETLLGVAE